jgi:mRNA interferase RelE/StbE
MSEAAIRATIYFEPDLHKAIRLEAADSHRPISEIVSLAGNPMPPGCEKLSGEEKYRVRQDIYRIIYQIEYGKLLVLVVKIGHRREVYRRS